MTRSRRMQCQDAAMHLRWCCSHNGTLWNVRRGQHHCGFMFAARITLAHFSVSSAMNLPKSVDDSMNGVLPNSASRTFILGSARAALISLLSLSTISAGVFLGAPTPFQPLAL